VFGPRQDPNGAYAAVIPKWIASMIQGEPVYINGDGETSRDFCLIANVVQANLLAATVNDHDMASCRADFSRPDAPSPVNQFYNVAVGDRTTLNELYAQLHSNLLPLYPHLQGTQPVYRNFRAADVRHSLADISKAATHLGYVPTQRINQGLELAMPWYIESSKTNEICFYPPQDKRIQLSTR
jgi:UDP-N-acetylglucosamine/UDP-N-acetylgalactosamine 4-epimerase